MINTPDTYTKAGERCAEARHVRDELLVAAFEAWFTWSLLKEQPDERKAARDLFYGAFRRVSRSHHS